MHPDRVEAVLTDTLVNVRADPAVRVLKVVHGYGSGGAAGTTRIVVRNWAYRVRGLIRAVINGESFAMSDPVTRDLRGEIGPFPDNDLDRFNPGITLLWIR